MSAVRSFDPIWEDLYAAGHQQRAPWDETVSFVFRNMPKDKPANAIKILEVGCGTASNLWFFAREGFEVTGIDASDSAILNAQARFKKDHLKGDLRTGDFTQLPYETGSFDLVIDRRALTCAGTSAMKKAIADIHRVLKKDGKFLFSPYSDSHSSCSAGRQTEDDLTVDIRAGNLKGFGQVRFVSRQEIDMLLPTKEWNVLSLESVKAVDMLSTEGLTLAYWRVISARRG